MDHNTSFHDCLKIPLSTIKSDSRYRDIPKGSLYKNKNKYQNRKVEVCARILEHKNENEINCLLKTNKDIRKESEYTQIKRGTIIKKPNIIKSTATKSEICKFIYNNDIDIDSNPTFFYHKKNIGDRWIFESALANIAFNKIPAKEVIPNDILVENENICIKVFYLDTNVRKHPYFSVFVDMFNQEKSIKNICFNSDDMKNYCRDNINDVSKIKRNHILILKFTKRNGAKFPEATLIGSASIEKKRYGYVYLDDVCSSDIKDDVRELLSNIDVITEESKHEEKKDSTDILKNISFGSLIVYIAFKWYIKIYPDSKKLHLYSTEDGLMLYLRNGFFPSRLGNKADSLINELETNVINNDNKSLRNKNLSNWLNTNRANIVGVDNLIKMTIETNKIKNKIKQQEDQNLFKFLKLDPRAFVHT